MGVWVCVRVCVLDDAVTTYHVESTSRQSAGPNLISLSIYVIGSLVFSHGPSPCFRRRCDNLSSERHLSNEDSELSPSYIEMCTRLPLK